MDTEYNFTLDLEQSEDDNKESSKRARKGKEKVFGNTD